MRFLSVLRLMRDDEAAADLEPLRPTKEGRALLRLRASGSELGQAAIAASVCSEASSVVSGAIG